MIFYKLTTDGELIKIDQDFDLDENGALPPEFNEFVHKQLSCELYEHVYAPCIGANVQMLADESGKLTGKKVNPIAWYFANGLDRRDPIVGDVLLCAMHRVGPLKELDYCGLSEAQCSYIKREFDFVKEIIKK